MGKLDRYDDMFENFSLMFPLAAEKAVSLYGSGRDEIVIILNDGYKFVWNDLTQSGRYLPPREDKLSEEFNEELWRKRFGARLEQAMLRRGGISCQAFAEAIGVSRAMLSRYLNGHSTPSHFIIKKMARVLGCPVSDLTDFPDFD